MTKLLLIFITLIVLTKTKANEHSFVISGKVSDYGYIIVNGQVERQPGSELILTVDNKRVTVKAR